MRRNIYASISEMRDLMGRIDYITSPERQENLYAIYKTDNDFPWEQLATECRQRFKESGAEGRCIEAREMILALPEELQWENQHELLKKLTEHFKEKYSVECVSALHHNKRETNYHIHLIFSERDYLQDPEIKIASRNMFYDENGKHVRTKKEIIDDEGNIRGGCKIIKKGEVYSRKMFGKKNPYFKDRAFVADIKHEYVRLINSMVQDEKDKLSVYDSSDIYLPTKKIGKNNPKAQEIEANNRAVVDWNYAADFAAKYVPREMVKDIKQIEITDRIAESQEAGTENKGRFRRIVKDATSVLNRFLQRWGKLPEQEKPVPKAESFTEMLTCIHDIVHKGREYDRGKER